MSENETIFEDYLVEKKDFFKRPKSWVIIISSIAAIVLLILFYKSVILETMSPKEVADSIEVVWYDTKWVEKESTPYEIKIVPSITFKVKNVGKRPLQYVNFESVFEFEDTGKVHSDGIAQVFREPLQPGEVSDEIFIKAFFGYSGKSKASFMNNTAEWKKMRAKLFANAKGSGPAQIGDIYPIKQEIEGYVPSVETKPEDRVDPIDQKSFELIGKSLQLTTVDSIWVDRIRSKEKSVIVPSIRFQVKNVGEESMQDIYFKGEFLFIDNNEKLGEGVVLALEKPLSPGETSKDVTIKSELGYEATSKEAFIHNNKTWREVKVRVFAKQKDFEYVLMGTYPIRQEIEGVKVIYKFK